MKSVKKTVVHKKNNAVGKVTKKKAMVARKSGY